ncbi:hypothetical protein RDI58_010801 [Solanum bulbocastanum]|uniref:Uncharacterized protein n=1 Tax=Solanum bulbocastanum TaxID=147425 RepID=A0AAN8TPY8_SOLBU
MSENFEFAHKRSRRIDPHKSQLLSVNHFSICCQSVVSCHGRDDNKGTTFRREYGSVSNLSVCLLVPPIWPGLPRANKLSFSKQYNQKNNLLRKRLSTPISFGGLQVPLLPEAGFDLLSKFLTYDPHKRITALNHEWFREFPLPESKENMPL